MDRPPSPSETPGSFVDWESAPSWTLTSTTRTLAAGVGDPGLFTWFLRWTPFAVRRRISPFVSDYLNHPDGINLMWNTWLPLPGLLLSPLTLFLGPVLTFNVLVTLAYGLSAWSAYLAIRRYVPSHGAAACGGLVYGFSPAMIGHAHHPNLILILLLPWLFVLLDEILVHQRRSPVWLGVALGAGSGRAAADRRGASDGDGAARPPCCSSCSWRCIRIAAADGGCPPLIALAVSLLVFDSLVALPLRAQIAGPARVHSDITEEVRGSSDLLAVVTPSRLSAIAPDVAIRLGDRFVGTRETYLGLPLLLVVVAVVLARRRSPLCGSASPCWWSAWCSRWGPGCGSAGSSPPSRCPGRRSSRCRCCGNMVPARLALFTGLFAGLLLAVAVEDLWRDGGWG